MYQHLPVNMHGSVPLQPTSSKNVCKINFKKRSVYEALIRFGRIYQL